MQDLSGRNLLVEVYACRAQQVSPTPYEQERKYTSYVCQNWNVVSDLYLKVLSLGVTYMHITIYDYLWGLHVFLMIQNLSGQNLFGKVYALRGKQESHASYKQEKDIVCIHITADCVENTFLCLLEVCILLGDVPINAMDKNLVFKLNSYSKA